MTGIFRITLFKTGFEGKEYVLKTHYFIFVFWFPDFKERLTLQHVFKGKNKKSSTAYQ